MILVILSSLDNQFSFFLALGVPWIGPKGLLTFVTIPLYQMRVS